MHTADGGFLPELARNQFSFVFRPFYTTTTANRFHHRSGLALYFTGKNAEKTYISTSSDGTYMK
jgi:hypothetical protein